MNEVTFYLNIKALLFFFLKRIFCCVLGTHGLAGNENNNFVFVLY